MNVRDHADLLLREREARDRIPHECAEIDVGETVGERAGVDSGGVQDVGDERRQPLRFAADQGEKGLSLVGVELSPALAEPTTDAIGARSSCETSETKSARSADSRRSSSTVLRSAW